MRSATSKGATKLNCFLEAGEVVLLKKFIASLLVPEALDDLRHKLGVVAVAAQVCVVCQVGESEPVLIENLA